MSRAPASLARRGNTPTAQRCGGNAPSCRPRPRPALEEKWDLRELLKREDRERQRPSRARSRETVSVVEQGARVRVALMGGERDLCIGEWSQMADPLLAHRELSLHPLFSVSRD